MSNPILAPTLKVQPFSETRKMAAGLQRLRALGRKVHHLGAGYPHPEVSDPTAYIEGERAYVEHLARGEGGARRRLLVDLYGYTDTMGPLEPRTVFTEVYGRDFGFQMDPGACVPTIGATGGIALLCSLYERSGEPVAYIVDAPTYTGFLSRAQCSPGAVFYSVPLDAEGPDPDVLARQIDRACAEHGQVAFYYTVPDGHNPGGISFSQARRDAIVRVCREKGVLIVEDAPYTYISYEPSERRPRPLVATAPEQVVHLFTASKLGLPGPRVAFAMAAARVRLADGSEPPLSTLLGPESATSILFHNPAALRAFEGYLHDAEGRPRETLWGLAEAKNIVYRANRQVFLDALQHHLGDHPELFSWTRPGGGFFSVLTLRRCPRRTDAAFLHELLAEHGVVAIAMQGFYAPDARRDNPDVGLDQLRLSFSYNESFGRQREEDLRLAVEALARALRGVYGLG
jgi:DNA-binding transcriptional MocR family regulator